MSSTSLVIVGLIVVGTDELFVRTLFLWGLSTTMRTPCTKQGVLTSRSFAQCDLFVHFVWYGFVVQRSSFLSSGSIGHILTLLLIFSDN